MYSDIKSFHLKHSNILWANIWRLYKCKWQCFRTSHDEKNARKPKDQIWCCYCRVHSWAWSRVLSSREIPCQPCALLHSSVIHPHYWPCYGDAPPPRSATIRPDTPPAEDELLVKNSELSGTELCRASFQVNVSFCEKKIRLSIL